MTQLKPAALAAAAALVAAFASQPLLAQESKRANGNSEDATKKIQAGAFSPRIFVRDEYRDNQDGSYSNTLVTLVEVPVGEQMGFRAEVPLTTRDPRTPGTDADFGLGDITTRLSRTMLTGDGWAAVLGVEYIWDSATEDSLGAGRPTISPLLFGSVRVPSLNTILFPNIQYYRSLDSDAANPRESYTVIKPMFLTRLPNRFYTFVEPSIYVDHERNDRVGMNLELEGGRFVNPQTMVYLRPGIGVHGDELPQVFNWNFEVGFRYFFR